MSFFRKAILKALALAGMVAVTFGLATAAHAENKTIRVGYQKYGTLVLLKEKGLLEARLKPLGYSVSWTEFPAGPQLLEALNVGSVDFGSTGEAPPIFAQAAGAPLLYVAYEPPSPAGEAILVPKDSPIKSVAELKGKRLALNKGSNVHYLVVRALENAGLSIKDVDISYLAPADARAAFEKGAIDAWAIWDPFFAAASAATAARTLADGTGVVANHEFYFAERKFAEANSQVIDAIVAALKEIDDWAKGEPKTVADLLSPRVGIPAPVLQVALGRHAFGVAPLSDEIIAEQQKIADVFHQLGLIPKPITVADAVRRTKS
jgi:sulfonate transport system substrate-binding protein